MRYKYKLNTEIVATQFKGDGIADLIELEHFLGIKPNIVYFTDGGKPSLVLESLNGCIFTANISDYIIKVSPGNYIVVPYQTFIKMYDVFGHSATHEDNLSYALYAEKKKRAKAKDIY